MRVKRGVAIAVAVAAGAAGGAFAGHVTQVDPATVPTGFLAAHNEVNRVPARAIWRAVKNRRLDVFVQHARLGANETTGWHTHPGPAIVTVVSGSFTYEDARRGECRRRTYGPGEGFVDRGFGHVHRGIAGASGADFYVTYLLPRGSANHLIPTTAPRACAS